MNVLPSVETRSVAVLFARRDSVYKSLGGGCDVFDIDRDALTWLGGFPCVCHPPCRYWGALRHLPNVRARASETERDLARWAVRQVRTWGGVLEHPKGSDLWRDQSLPLPGDGEDEHGGYTLRVDQSDFGHLAQKPTWLYICHIARADIPPIPLRFVPITHGVIGTLSLARRAKRRRSALLEIPRCHREHTPRMFAEWLIRAASAASI